MNERDDLLRAAVYAAWEHRFERDELGCPSAALREACERVVTVHEMWPLIEYEHALQRAELERVQRLRDERELLDWYRSIDPPDLSFDTERACVA